MALFDDLDRLDPARSPRWKRAVLAVAWFSYALWDQLRQDKVVIRSSGLAYGSLLATVPAAAVIFGLLSAFGALEDLRAKVQEELLAGFLPSHQDEILRLLDQFIANASKVGVVGFIALTITVIMLLDAIESNFNEIWGVPSRRRLISKITAYTSVLVFGSLFIGASLSISARIKTALLLTGPPIQVGLIGWLERTLFPPFLSLLAFLLMYLIIPYARVHRSSAIFGAVTGSVLWEAAKSLFAASVGGSIHVSTIYGSLAVFPIFLIWLNVTWVIVLLGLEITFTHQHFKPLLREHLWRRSQGGERTALGLKLYAAIAEAFDRGEPPPTDDDLSERFEAPLGVVEGFLKRFEAAELLRRAAAGAEDEGFLPARPLGQVAVAEVLLAVLGNGREPLPNAEPLARAVDQALAEYQAAGFAALGSTTFEELVHPPPPPESG